MSQTAAPSWHELRREETHEVEDVLRKAGFRDADAYRYNSASIRVRVIDIRFEGMPIEERDAMIESHLRTLPERTQADIINLLTLAPSELQQSRQTLREWLLNLEFEEPSRSMF